METRKIFQDESKVIPMSWSLILTPFYPSLHIKYIKIRIISSDSDYSWPFLAHVKHKRVILVFNNWALCLHKSSHHFVLSWSSFLGTALDNRWRLALISQVLLYYKRFYGSVNCLKNCTVNVKKIMRTVSFLVPVVCPWNEIICSF